MECQSTAAGGKRSAVCPRPERLPGTRERQVAGGQRGISPAQPEPRRGVGFFEESSFYPDFILWIVDKNSRRIVFIEPRGMVHTKAYVHDEKARLWERLPELAQQIGNRSGRQNITLDSYIISATAFNDLSQRYGDDGDKKWDRQKFAEKHILFQERDSHYDYYVRHLFRFQDGEHALHLTPRYARRR